MPGRHSKTCRQALGMAGLFICVECLPYIAHARCVFLHTQRRLPHRCASSSRRTLEPLLAGCLMCQDLEALVIDRRCDFQRSASVHDLASLVHRFSALCFHVHRPSNGSSMCLLTSCCQWRCWRGAKSAACKCFRATWLTASCKWQRYCCTVRFPIVYDSLGNV